MKPVTPVIPGMDLPEVVFAKDQPQYLPLPAYRFDDGTVVSRWRMTWWERLRVLVTGNVWLTLLTFNGPLQPSKLTTFPPMEFSK